MLPRRSRPPPSGLHEAHRLVLQILSAARRELTWEELRAAAADVGIDEEELSLVMYGTRTPPKG